MYKLLSTFWKLAVHVEKSKIEYKEETKMDTDETTQNTAEDGVPNDASGVSDNRSRETLPQQELLAIGGEIEDEHFNTSLAEDDCNPHAQQPPSAPLRSQFHRSSNSETCDCTMGNTTVAHLNGVKCSLCGRVIKTRRNLTVEESLATSTRETEPCVSALSETLITGFARISQTPLPSLDGNQSTKDYVHRDQRSALPVELDEDKVPMENFSDTSVQIPCIPSTLTLFILKQTHQATNEQQFSIYFTADFQQRRIPSWIKQMERHHGLKLVSFGDELLSQKENQYLHQICLEDGLTLKFELVKQIHRKFRIRDAQVTHKVPLHRIQSLCQNRIPGPTVRVCVQSLCEPGEVCQDHLRMTLKYGKTICRMLIPIWSSGQP